MQFDQNDVDLFCLCIWKEARGEGLTGMEAVGHVIYNRVGFPGFGKTLHDVIMGKNQFTSMSVPSDREFNLQPMAHDRSYENIEDAAPAILNGTDNDLTDGAHYYADLQYATSGWFADHIVDDPINHRHTVRIGKHDFFV